MKNKLLLLICFFVAVAPAFPRAQYSLLQPYGSKCQNCHFNTQGGGLRNGAGFLARNAMSLISPSTIGLQGAFDAATGTNAFFGEKLLVGLDLRYQNAKWGSPAKSTRDNMLMQFTPSIGIKITDWLEVEGFYNIAYDLEKLKRYNGQQKYSASVYIKPDKSLPSLRVGYFQPTVGLKWDDHTLMVRNAGDNLKRYPIIPDDYAEFGAQIDYEAIESVGLSFGVFDTKNLTGSKEFPGVTVMDAYGKTESLVREKSVSYVFRAGYYPAPLGNDINAFALGTMYYNGGLDGSKLTNNYFLMQSLSLNVGWSDKLALLTEFMHTEKQWARQTNNLATELDYQPMEGLMLFARAEKALTTQRLDLNTLGDVPYDQQFEDYKTNQFVFGAHIILLPSIEILPEYRIYDREAVPGYWSQWAFQLHAYF